MPGFVALPLGVRAGSSKAFYSFLCSFRCWDGLGWRGRRPDLTERRPGEGQEKYIASSHCCGGGERGGEACELRRRSSTEKQRGEIKPAANWTRKVSNDDD